MQIGQGVVGDPRGHLEEAPGAADGHAAHDEEEGREVDLAELGAVEEPDAGEEGRKGDADEHQPGGDAVQLVRGEQDEGNEHEDGGALLFGRHRAEFLILGLQGGAQGLPIHLGREDQHDQPHRHEGIQHTGKEVMHGVFHPCAADAGSLLQQAHAEHEVRAAREVAQFGRRHGEAAGEDDGGGFAALGLEVQCVAQADADGAEDGGLACDGRDERGHDGYGEGNADKSAGETAAHAAHASQTDALAEACFL